MAKSGQASVEVLADFSRFAAKFKSDLNAALQGVKVDMSGISNQIEKGIKDGVDAAGKEFGKLDDKMGVAASGISRKSKDAATKMAESFISAGNQVSSVGDKMSTSLSLPLAAVGTAVVMTAGNFEKSMNRVKAVSGATADQFSALRQEAIDLGSTTQYSASQAADAMGYLSMAGFDATQTLEALPGVLDLAAAGAVDLGQAADIASNILSGYGFEASQLGSVNDILAKTFTRTNTTLSMLGESFKYVGPIASSAGLSFEETSAAIGLMGNAGIQGSEAGTALRGAISRILKPTKEVNRVLSSMGISLTDSSGKMLPLVDILKELESAGADTADMIKIFGVEAGPAMQALLSQGSGALADLTTELQNAGGTASSIAKIQMEGLNGTLDELKSAAEGLMIAIGDAGLLGWMTSLAGAMTSVTMDASRMSPTLLKVATIVGIIVAAIGPFLAVFGRMMTMIGEGILAFKKFGGWIAKLAPGLAAMSGPVGLVIAGIIALVVAAVIAYKKIDAFRNIVDRAFRAIAAAAVWMWQSAIVPAFTWMIAQARTVGSAVMGLLKQAQPVFVALGAAVLQVWTSAIRPAFVAIGGMFGSLGSAVAGFWSGTVQPALSALMAGFGRLAVAIRSWWSGNGDGVMAQAAAVVTWLGGVLTTVFTGIMAVLKGVVAVVVWAFINVVLPVFQAVIAVVKTVINVIVAMKPVWIILGAIIVAAVIVVIAIIKILWSVITVVFTAIGAILKWLWTSIVIPVFTAIGVAITAVSAVIQWLWSSIISPVFTAIGAIIGAIGTVIIWLWTSVFMPAFTAIGAVVSWLWSTIISPVFTAIGIAITAVVAVVMWFASTFGPIFVAIGNLVWTVWSGAFLVVFDLLKLAFFAVVAVVQVFWSAIQVVFMAVAAIALWLWSSAISPALSAIGALFTWLWTSAISPALSAIGELFTWLWSSAISPALNFVSAGLTWLWGIIKTIFAAVVLLVRAQISQIVAAANGITGFVNSISSHFQSAVNAVRDKIGSMVSFVRDLPGRIINAVGNLASLLYGAGQNVINGLIDGISSRIAALRAKISSAASAIRNALPFSPAKEGPLSGSGDPTIAGGKIVSMVAAGIESRIPKLRAAAWGLADAASSAQTGGLSSGLSALTGAASGGTQIVFQPGSINVTFSGAVPSAAEAAATGAAVGQGIAAELSRSRTATLVRSI